ncbi:MAG TPA: hypothetical protein VM370_02745 [Candidatus Thermoplasmatota archaeon]|nr:hypothetical protein [Candidatus Thermoplasmatota archaeon]
MPSPRTLWLAAIAFLAGLALAAVLLTDGGSPLRSLAPHLSVPIDVRVVNVGTHEANVSVHAMGPQAGEGSREYRLAPGADRTDRLAMGSGTVVVTIRAQWSAPAAQGIGDRRVQGDADACGPEEALGFDIELDTTRGVSFPSARASCG